MARKIAITMPWSTPTKITPRDAMTESTTAERPDLPVADQGAEVQQRQRRRDHYGGEGRLREVREEVVEEQEQHEHEARAHDPGELGLGTGLLGHRGA